MISNQENNWNFKLNVIRKYQLTNNNYLQDGQKILYWDIHLDPRIFIIGNRIFSK